MRRQYDVLDHGFVRLVDRMGSDAAVVQAARVSYGEGTETPSSDAALIQYLMRHHHTTPFEMCELKFHLKMPISTARQHIRHRTASINEYSTRYSEAPDETYVIDYAGIQAQSTTNKQGREDGALTAGDRMDIQHIVKYAHNVARTAYKSLLSLGLARESARDVLPLAQYTELYWKIDLHNLFHFLQLRLDSHAQFEIREYARSIARIVGDLYPVSWAAFCEYRLHALTLGHTATRAVQLLLANAPDKLRENFVEDLKRCFSKREQSDVLKALGVES